MAQDQSPLHIALIGDSTIDNIVWVGNQQDTVVGQLQSLLPDSARIAHLAADGFTTRDVLRGRFPMISFRARAQVGDPFPGLEEGKIFEPLRVLAETPGVTHAVLSVGGNDVRVILGNMRQLPNVQREFLENYPNIVESILHTLPAPRLALMLQYCPSLNADRVYHVYRAMSALPGPGDGLSKLHTLMARMYAPSFHIARVLHLPIIDLTRSFNPHDDTLYHSQIEPSAIGSKLIAKIIAHVVQHHDFEGPSKFYWLPSAELETGEVREELNLEEVNPDDAESTWAQKLGVPVEAKPRNSCSSM
eukprot:TRINITY_DN2300_c0_g1_i4.p1 TRINITY_DN2300_c0_g1~~TRINITY_DN2300_c0_g1_i4.p1  ORF type:complete len:337 (-),score=89.92 TRINITY_DN2300_c0_g1_i4:208-1119(-)